MLLFKVASVEVVADCRHERWCHTPAEYRTPVHVTEPSMFLDVSDAVRQIPVPPGHVHLEYVPQQVHHVARKTQRTAVLSVHDVTEQLPGVTFIDERRTVGQHLI